MDALIRFGFSMEEIKDMMDTNDKIEETSDKNINELIEVLKAIGCTESQIKNIFLCNPFCLSKKVSIINSFIQKLKNMKCSFLSQVLDSNPYLLNIEIIDLEKWINMKKEEGLSNEEILDNIECNRIF